MLEFERQKEVRVCVAVGGEMLSEAAEAAVLARRAARLQRLEVVETAAAMARPGVEAALGAGYFCQEDAASSSAEEPEFNLETNDTWKMRQQVCDRFVQAGRKIILRQRAERRLQGVRSGLHPYLRPKCTLIALYMHPICTLHAP